jgi:hypothetical protein
MPLRPPASPPPPGTLTGTWLVAHPGARFLGEDDEAAISAKPGAASLMACMVPIGAEMERAAAGQRLERHHHAGYAALVLRGSYVEAGDRGRIQAEPGHVLFYAAFEGHFDTMAPRARTFSTSSWRPCRIGLPGAAWTLIGWLD